MGSVWHMAGQRVFRGVKIEDVRIEGAMKRAIDLRGTERVLFGIDSMILVWDS